MQAVILTAGAGTRLRPITEHIPKPLIPFWGRPFIDYLLETFEGLVDEVIIVIGATDDVREHVGDRFGSLPVRYARQPYPAGTGDAILRAEEMLEGAFILNLGDTWVPRETLQGLIESDADAVLTTIEVDDPANHLGVLCDENGCVVEMWADCATVDAGCFRLPTSIFDYLRGMPPRNGELRVLQGVQALLEEDATVGAVLAPNPWLQFGDHEGREGVLRVMRQMAERVPGIEASGGSSVNLPATGCEISNSLVFGPGEVVNCTIRDSVLYCGRRVEGETIDGELTVRV